MAARSDVNCTVHTHASAAVAFAALDVPLRALSHDGVPFAAPDIPRFTDTGSLIHSRDLGVRLAETIGDAAGCLIPQHGLVTVGHNAATAVMRAVMLDRACRTQLLAMAAGPLRRWSDPAEIALKQAQVWSDAQVNAGYAYLCRQIPARSQDISGLTVLLGCRRRRLGEACPGLAPGNPPPGAGTTLSGDGLESDPATTTGRRSVLPDLIGTNHLTGSDVHVMDL